MISTLRKKQVIGNIKIEKCSINLISYINQNIKYIKGLDRDKYQKDQIIYKVNQNQATQRIFIKIYLLVIN